MSETRTAVLVSSPVQIEVCSRGVIYFIPHKLCPIDGLTDTELCKFEDKIGPTSYTLRQLDGPPVQPEPVTEEVEIKTPPPRRKKKTTGKKKQAKPA